MTDLDTTALRLALKAPGDPGDPVDVTQIMTRGRQLRRRRRRAAVAGGICAVAILAGAGTAVANLTAAPPPRTSPSAPHSNGWPGSARQGPAAHARALPAAHTHADREPDFAPARGPDT